VVVGLEALWPHLLLNVRYESLGGGQFHYVASMCTRQRTEMHLFPVWNSNIRSHKLRVIDNEFVTCKSIIGRGACEWRDAFL
jgi:hypothetical protein